MNPKDNRADEVDEQLRAIWRPLFEKGFVGNEQMYPHEVAPMIRYALDASKALIERREKAASHAQTKRLRNLIRQQGAGSWQRVFELELAALSTERGEDERSKS